MKQKRNYNVFLAVPVVLLSVLLMVWVGGCGSDTVTLDDTEMDGNGDEQKIAYNAMFYNNDGECYIGFQGNTFDITANKVKQWGYSTDGKWTSWYETASVINITVDGETIPSTGSTLLLMDSRIKMTPVSDVSGGMYGNPAGEEYTVSVNNHPLKTFFGLTHWWYNTHEPGQGGAKLVLIQSQNGNDIGIIEGDNVKWEIEGKLPKTTKITVDGLPVYIHRANFIIIPRSLIEKSQKFMEEME